MPQTEYDEVITIRINPSMLREVDKLAVSMGKTRAEIVRDALTAIIGANLNARQPETATENRA